ncbi:MAG TPA: alpha/beta fold hydrolase [Thermodesulfobacteriota bacterium]|nr:alpha/beta fold hydrolase [Thermodesulfobacteriota bacterium]
MTLGRNPHEPRFRPGLERRKRQFVRRGIAREDVEAVFGRLATLDPGPWVAAWTALAEPYEARAAAAEREGRFEEARRLYERARAYYTAARFPVTDAPEKRQAYRKVVETFLKAARYADPPVERVAVPFPGHGEIVGYLRKPPGVARPPLVIETGGVDVYKEERDTGMYLEAGLATFAVDMPGAGESPVRYTPDGHRLYSALLDYFATRPDLDSRRIALVGRSYGGYWGATMAYREPERLAAAVQWGGPVHHGFQVEWLERRKADTLYLWDVLDSLMYAHGVTSFEALCEVSPRHSLETLGLLDRPSAPLLVIGGVTDGWFPLDDLYIHLQHGAPKAARVYPEHEHMGGPDAADHVVRWLVRELARP